MYRHAHGRYQQKLNIIFIILSVFITLILSSVLGFFLSRQSEESYKNSISLSRTILEEKAETSLKNISIAAAGKSAERDKLARAERQAHIPQGGRELPGVGKGQAFDAIELHVRASFLCSSTGVRQSRKYASSTLAEYGVSTPRAVG